MPRVKRKKRSKKKDPKKPKRAMSSFMFFANDKRKDVLAAEPTLKITDVGRKLGVLWKELPPEERKKYEEMSRSDAERYAREMETYQPPEDSPSSEEGESDNKKRKRAKKDPNKPKRGMSSFMYFANEKRSEVRDKFPGLKVTDLGKKLSEMWKELPEDVKKKYELLAQQDKERYKQAMQSYKPPSHLPIQAPVIKESESSSDSDSDSSSDSDDNDNDNDK